MVQDTAAQTSETQRQPMYKNLRKVDWAIVAGTTLVLAILAFIAAGNSNLTTIVANIVSWAGVFLTVVGIVIALLIFRRQDNDSRRTNAQTGQVLNGIANNTSTIQQQLAGLTRLPLSADEQSYQDDVESDDDEVVTQRSAIPVVEVDGKEGETFTQQDVPLHVVGDLAAAWREMPDQNGDWTVANIVGAWRARGQGNNPWYVTFQSSAGQGRVWRLYRGGRSNRAPIARDMTAEMTHQE
ncbi:hypothetical protein F8O07_06635 [Pseudoclavibacter sp. CFCC 13796]|uniref:hypothetical protein n=1 Tax=Pseudoclavibacter sp. CFCC 13796 TaxID=2615179 RepID=UPI001300CA81|nr:hypothetical protein [Pseudoclavibacter sp. CFCC 13796]KAB1661575.1 hypothetical protein F8O07_06635 [Pseudoclavibacter sp. CFCC 13796]